MRPRSSEGKPGELGGKTPQQVDTLSTALPSRTTDMGERPVLKDGSASAGFRGWQRLSSGLTVATLLTALLYVQGRAYRSGYLEALGFSESQFPITTTDALWLAFNGWLLGAVQIPGASWHAFKSQLLSTGVWLFPGLFVTLCLLVLLTPERLAYANASNPGCGHRRNLQTRTRALCGESLVR